MVEILVPAAGLSTRFSGMRPKYLLYDYKNEIMLLNAIKPYIGKYNITIGILKEHDEEFGAQKYLRHEFGNLLNIVVLDDRTKGPADTVQQIITKSNFSSDSPFLVKDCDSFFDHTIEQGNYVCTSSVSNHPILKKLSSKSFVVTNEQGIITDIVEKSVVSQTFCVGGYKFSSIKLFLDAFQRLNHIKELFVSDVIQQCLIDGEIFSTNAVTNYYDVGTAEDWFDYNNKAVLFCDIDGTVVEAMPKFNYTTYRPIQKNVDILLKKQKEGCQFVFVTARPESARTDTENMLAELGFQNFTLIDGLLNAKRILINDFNEGNPYPRAESINIERNSDKLDLYLK